MASPVLALVLLEGILRVGGFGYPASFLIHHAATGPEAWVENQRFSWRFFPRTLARHPNPFVVRPDKPPTTCRVLVLGESAAEGDPAPAFGFARILQVLLQDRYPQTRFEVINAAFTAINSQVIVPIARDCRRLDADLWLVYLGNNEVIGPYGAGTVFGGQAAPSALVNTSLALKSTRVGQGVDALWQRLNQSRNAAQGWGGMTMFLEHQVPLADPRLPGLQDRFAQNLGEIIRLGTQSGARVVVSTVASRLRDWPPFASQHRPDWSATAQHEWQQHFDAGVAAETAGNLEAARQAYERAAHLDDRFAELRYRQGRVLLALGQPDAARTHLVMARDLDTLRFRTDSELNDCIRRTVAARPSPDLRMLDAEQVIAARSTNGIAGVEWFLEHVHFNFAGNYLLARLFAETLIPLLPPRVAAEPSNPDRDWLSESECARRLAYTDSQRFEVTRLLLHRFEEPIYQQQTGHADRYRQVEAELNGLRAAAKPALRRRSLDGCREALALAPDDWVLHDLTARLLGGLGDYAAAEAEWREVTRLIPHASDPHTERGKLLATQARWAEAVEAFLTALRVNPDDADALAGLGSAYRRQGRTDDAARCFQQALRLDPTCAEAAEGLSRLTGKPARP